MKGYVGAQAVKADEGASVYPLAARGLAKSYGQKRALRGADLSVREGEIFGLIGLNGAGKTTFIKIILDLLRADAGTASFFGVPCVKTESRREVAYLPEKFNPGHLLRGREFLEIQLACYGLPYRDALAREACALLDLAPDALDMRVGKYSKGMGQKLGLISVLLTEAKLLILDEPMSGLDPKARALLKRALIAAREAGRTVFFSSHILADVAEICGRIAVMHDGELQFCGTPAECLLRADEAANLEEAFLRLIGVGN